MSSVHSVDRQLSQLPCWFFLLPLFYQVLFFHKGKGTQEGVLKAFQVQLKRHFDAAEVLLCLRRRF